MKITIVRLQKYLEWRDEGRLTSGWKYLAYDPEGKVWLAVDNTSGDFFMEEFSSETTAIRWLLQSI